MRTHRIGAFFYILWGLLHIAGGLAIAGQNELPAQLAMQGSALPAEKISQVHDPLIHGIVSYHGYNLAWLGVLAIAIGAIFNWRNQKTGYWLNLTVLGMVEIGLFAFLVLPGFMALSEAMIGLTLFVLAVAFTSIGFRNACTAS